MERDHDELRRLYEPPVKEVERRGDAIVVRLTGELDLYNVPLVREALLAATAERPQRLVVDLGDVSFLDSTALGLLVEARTRLERPEGFVLAAPGPEARRTLEVSGLDRHFVVVESADDAPAAGG